MRVALHFLLKLYFTTFLREYQSFSFDSHMYCLTISSSFSRLSHSERVQWSTYRLAEASLKGIERNRHCKDVPEWHSYSEFSLANLIQSIITQEIQTSTMSVFCDRTRNGPLYLRDSFANMAIPYA